MKNSSSINKVAIITGASGGIGSEIARQLANQNIVVVVSYSNNPNNAEQLVKEIIASGGVACSFRANVANAEDVDALFQFVLDKFSKIDIVVNNAGVVTRSLIKDITKEMYDSVFGINTFGALLIMQACAKYMSDNGRIINSSSTLVIEPIIGSALYTASKAALEIMGKVLSKELGERGITVNNIRIGSVLPGMFAGATAERKELVAQKSPFKRLGTPDDIAKVVSFLASDNSKWITGSNITVDGGAS